LCPVPSKFTSQTQILSHYSQFLSGKKYCAPVGYVLLIDREMEEEEEEEVVEGSDFSHEA